MSTGKLYSAEEARALREASPTKGRWLQAFHIDEPRAIVDATRRMHSMLGLDSDGMAIFNEPGDASLACAAGDLTETVEHLHERARQAEALAQIHREERDACAAELLRLRANMETLRAAVRKYFAAEDVLDAAGVNALVEHATDCEAAEAELRALVTPAVTP